MTLVVRSSSCDPAGFRLDDCATQRTLTDAGRADAKRVGAAFQTRAIPVSRVLSSPWCRCLETARLAFGRAEVWTPLSNLFDNRARGRSRGAGPRAAICCSSRTARSCCR